MLESTKESYRKLARHFYTTRVGEVVTPKKITDALKACAKEYTPAYWRRLRNALEFDQREKKYSDSADRIRSTVNPITSDSKLKHLIKPKRRKVKFVAECDEEKLLAHLKRSDLEGDRYVLCAVRLVKYLGCRPAELLDLEFLPGRKVLITSAKKTGDRGLDRLLTIKDKKIFGFLEHEHQIIFEAEHKNVIRYVQRRLAAVTQNLWPQRKARPSLYSWRHQMGCDLKVSGKSRKEIAAIMGHFNVESVNVYGRSKHARSPREYLSVAKKTVMAVKDKSEKLPYSKVQNPKSSTSKPKP